jgi:hypothetical protein
MMLHLNGKCLYLKKMNDQHKWKYLVATREKIVSSKKVCVAHIKIFERLIDNIFVGSLSIFGVGKGMKQT